MIWNIPLRNLIQENLDVLSLDESRQTRWRDNEPSQKGQSGYYDDWGEFHPCRPEDLNDKTRFLQALNHNRVAKFAYRYNIDTEFFDIPNKKYADKVRKLRSDFISEPSKYNRYDKLWIDDIADRPVMAKLRVSNHPFVFGSWAQHNPDCDCCLNILLPDEEGEVKDANRDFVYDYRCDHQVIALTFRYDMYHPTRKAEDWMRQLMMDIQTGKQPHVSLTEIRANVDPRAKIEKSSMYNLRSFNYKQSPNKPRIGQPVLWKHEEELRKQEQDAAKQKRREEAESTQPLKVVKMSDINKAVDTDSSTVTITDKDTGKTNEYFIIQIGNFKYLYDMDADKAYYFKKGNESQVNTASKRKALEVKINMNESFRRGRNKFRLTEGNLRNLIRNAFRRMIP